MKEKKPKFDQEFINSAVKMVEMGDGNKSKVARELGLPEWQVRAWVRQSKQKVSTGTDAIIQENKRLKKELARAQEEAAILKKAVTYFAQHQQ